MASDDVESAAAFIERVLCEPAFQHAFTIDQLIARDEAIAARARREALEECARVCDNAADKAVFVADSQLNDYEARLPEAYAHAARKIAAAIRALNTEESK